MKVRYNGEFKDLGLTKGEEYRVIEYSKEKILIKDDSGNKTVFPMCIFEKVEPQKEYSVMQIFEENEGIKFKIEGLNYIYFASNGILRRTIDGKTVETLYLDKFILNKKFIKVEEPKLVTTAEAFKALDEGETIESLVTKDRYRYDTDKNNNLQIKFHNLDDYETALEVRAVEIEGRWIIKGDSEWENV